MKSAIAHLLILCAAVLAEEPTAAVQPQTVATPGGCKLCALATKDLSGITETPWLEPAARKKAWTTSCEVSNQDGKKFKLDDLIGKPIAITFLYSRCENPNKCPLAAATAAKLQLELRKADIEKHVQLVVMTYDPEFDSPEVLSRYAAARGIQCNANVMMLRPDTVGKNALFDDMKVLVNYNGDRVNIHGLQMILIDKAGRTVRKYHTLIWENANVLENLKKLVAE
ncbi:MAG: SCO family protein [Planctomycetota bacterium]